jgi:hypothetical protein
MARAMRVPFVQLLEQERDRRLNPSEDSVEPGFHFFVVVVT